MFRFTLNAKELDILQALDKIASAKKSLAAQSLLLLEVADNLTIRLTAFNDEARMTAMLHPTEVEGEGRICIEPKKLGALTRAIGDMPMTITYDDNTNMVGITTPNGKYNLNAYDAADYPQADKVDGLRYDIVAEYISRGVKATAFAAATDADYRPQLQGVHINFGNSALTFTATDTRVLAQLSFADFSNEETAEVVIPTKYAQMMASFCDEVGDNKVTLTISGKTLTLNTGDIKITSVLVAGTYPAVERAFPHGLKNRAEVDAQTLRTALSRVAILANERVPAVNISADATGEIRVSTIDEDTQQNASETIYGATDEPISMYFGYKVLVNAISVFTGDIIMQAVDATHPALFVPAQNEQHTRYCVLAMPIMK